MRKRLCLTAILVLPLLVVGGFLHVHAGKGSSSSVAAGQAEEPCCPLECLMTHIHQWFQH
jgi:hypothetical protein